MSEKFKVGQKVRVIGEVMEISPSGNLTVRIPSTWPPGEKVEPRGLDVPGISLEHVQPIQEPLSDPQAPQDDPGGGDGSQAGNDPPPQFPPGDGSA